MLNYIFEALVYLILCGCFVALVFYSSVISRRAQSVSILIFALVLSLATIELLIRLGLFSSVPLWISTIEKQRDRAINKEHYKFASANQFGFNDIFREQAKADGTIRCAVLGDSFIFGDGLPRAEIWSIKLANKIETKYPRTEVLNWGKNGWSTRDQLDFLKRHAELFDLDCVIMGFVTNDPDLSNTSQSILVWQTWPLFNPLRRVFPETLNFGADLINRFIEIQSDSLGYENWENALYTTENLAKYQLTLNELSNFCQRANIRLLMVLTPNNYEEYFARRYKVIIPMLEQAQIQYLNLRPAVVKHLSHYPLQSLRASRANGHPGSLVTEVFATEVFNHLQMENSLSIYTSQQ